MSDYFKSYDPICFLQHKQFQERFGVSLNYNNKDQILFITHLTFILNNISFTMTIEIKACFNSGATATFIDVNLILHLHKLQTFETSIKMVTQKRVFGLKNYTIEKKKALAAKVSNNMMMKSRQ